MGTILKNGINYSGTSGGSGVSSYTELTEKPKINNVVLTGNKTTADLGITSPTKTSDLTNDSGFYSSSDTAETTIADGDYFPFYDVSASGRKKTLWSNIKSALGSVFQPKLTAGNNITIDANNNIYATMPVMGTFSKADLYSTTEKVIGCWTDGRPLYQKVVNFGTGANKTVKSVSHGVSNISTLVDLHFFGQMGSGSGSSGSLVAGMCDATYEYWSDSGAISAIAVYLMADKIYMDCKHDASIYTYKVVIKYTKTSDSTNSYNYASENDYSTSEKIIGTWITGATLYQKTITVTFPTTAALGTEASSDITLSSLGLSSMTRCVEMAGIIVLADGKNRAINQANMNGTTVIYACAIVDKPSGVIRLITDMPAVGGQTAYITLKYIK